MNNNKKIKGKAGVSKTNLSVKNVDFKYIFSLGFIVFAFFLTVGENDYYLKWSEGFSLFLFTTQYFVDCMQLLGGLLTYVGAFLMQFFHYPPLGSCMLIVLLLYIQCLTVTAYDIPHKYYPLSFVRPLKIPF